MNLETGHLIENFVNYWYFNQKYAGIVKMLEMFEMVVGRQASVWPHETL